MESVCAAIQNTSCMADPKDEIMRCLCGDYSAPINGVCTNKFQGKNAMNFKDISSEENPLLTVQCRDLD